MEYVLLDMRWNMILSNKKLDFDVNQLAAIHVDQELHTESTFHRLNVRDSRTAKQITYMMDISEDVITDFQSAWEEFKQWLPEDVVFIVWNSEIKNVIQRCNKIFRKKPIRARFIDLQRLQEIMMSKKSRKRSIEGAMNALELICEQSYMLSVLYCVQCMLRLYRKLWKEALKHFEQHQWERILMDEYFTDLQQIEFFPELISKQLRVECRGMVKKFCLERKFELHAKGTQFEIDTDHAVWQFDLANWGEDLVYVPKKYVQLPHHDMKIESQERNIVDVLQQILAGIVSTDERLKYGVGSAEVERVLSRLCDCRNAIIIRNNL